MVVKSGLENTPSARTAGDVVLAAEGGVVAGDVDAVQAGTAHGTELIQKTT